MISPGKGRETSTSSVTKETATVTPLRRLCNRIASAVSLPLAVLGAVLVVAAALPAVAAADESFGLNLKTFSNRTTDEADAPYTVAGGHPYQNTNEFSVTLKGGGDGRSAEVLNGVYVNPPLGFIGNPAAATRCPIAKIASTDHPEESDCPPGSRVGTAFTTIDQLGNGASTTTRPLYNIPPERGYPAQFMFKVTSVPTVISVFPQPRSKSYGLTVG